ncbi:MAG: hypothetical protein LQ348_007282 [Seirophora lacunosa]|nr:MAG: hypothetical protein LQ348_007282 [Seirophora lacunosa]
MARTGRTPRAVKQREGNYVNPGVVGRATGITVGDLGPRDEHGMEPTTGLFSSPEKSPPKRNGVLQHSTIDEDDETMNIGSSTIPEPTEVIKARNGPPPKSRSPIKTNLGSAARRSLGPLSSPSRRPEDQNETPTHRAMSHPPNRRLDFSINESHTSSVGSSNRGKLPASRGAKLKPTPLAGKRKRGPFDLEPTPDLEPLASAVGLTNGNASAEYDDEDLNYGGMDETPQLANGDDSRQLIDSLGAQDQEMISPSIERDTVAAAGKPNKKRGNPAFSKLAQAKTIQTTPGSGRRGRPPKKPKLDPPTAVPTEEEAEGLAEEPANEAAEEPAEEQVEETTEEPAKPPKPSGRGQKTTMQPPKAKAARGKAALGLKDPNNMLKPPKTSRRASSVAAKASMSPTKTRFIARSETPGDELHFMTTRAGRNVVKPLAYWRGETAVFSPGRIEGGQHLLPSIKEVIRTEEVPEPRRKKTPGQPRKRRAKPVRPEEDDELPEEEDDEGEYWETEGGVMQASVMLWDPMTGRGDEDNKETADVAYAADAVEMRDINGADFRFAKTLTLPFFGSGMVDLPPGGTKRVKNSRKMQMVFFVFYGRVLVELGTPTQRFSIGRGGMWQVPRGNFYAITNNASKPARIFFAQGCEVASESAGFDESGAA